MLSSVAFEHARGASAVHYPFGALAALIFFGGAWLSLGILGKKVVKNKAA
jgi:hypothetical protein